MDREAYQATCSPFGRETVEYDLVTKQQQACSESLGLDCADPN